MHRNLKPGNILPAPQPKVVDFGLAKKPSSHDLTRTDAIMGTPSYTSPEQAKGNAKFVGPQADVHALGVILYELLTDTRPFEADDTFGIVTKVAEDEPDPPQSENRACREI